MPGRHGSRNSPIFYPVLNEDYATKIARDWNVKTSGVGYVTRFSVDKSFLDPYPVHQAGGRTILEVPDSRGGPRGS